MNRFQTFLQNILSSIAVLIALAEKRVNRKVAWDVSLKLAAASERLREAIEILQETKEENE